MSVASGKPNVRVASARHLGRAAALGREVVERGRRRVAQAGDGRSDRDRDPRRSRMEAAQADDDRGIAARHRRPRRGGRGGRGVGLFPGACFPARAAAGKPIRLGGEVLRPTTWPARASAPEAHVVAGTRGPSATDAPRSGVPVVVLLSTEHVAGGRARSAPAPGRASGARRRAGRLAHSSCSAVVGARRWPRRFSAATRGRSLVQALHRRARRLSDRPRRSAGGRAAETGSRSASCPRPRGSAAARRERQAPRPVTSWDLASAHRSHRKL